MTHMDTRKESPKDAGFAASTVLQNSDEPDLNVVASLTVPLILVFAEDLSKLFAKWNLRERAQAQNAGTSC